MEVFLLICLYALLIIVISFFITMWFEYTIIGRATSKVIASKIKSRITEDTGEEE